MAPLAIGADSISKLYLGADEVVKAYLGTDEVYSSGPARTFNWRRNSSRDIDLVSQPSGLTVGGIWSDGTTMYHTHYFGGVAAGVRAYRLSDGRRDSAKDIPTQTHGNRFPRGITGHGATMYIVNDSADTLMAYKISDRTRDSSKDIPQTAFQSNSQTSLVGAWTDGTTIWVCDAGQDTLFAYTLSTKVRDTTKDITCDSANSTPLGIWSNGTLMWACDENDTIYAYKLSDGSRVSHEDFNTRNVVGGGMILQEMWSDGTNVWLAGGSRSQVSKILAFT